MKANDEVNVAVVTSEQLSGTNSTTEYRVVWKRAGLRPKRKRYVSRARADRFMLFFSPEPWRAFGKTDGDRYECCNGYECGCGGLTYREKAEQIAADMPKLEYVRLEVRQVGRWDSLDPSQANAVIK